MDQLTVLINMGVICLFVVAVQKKTATSDRTRRRANYQK